MKALVIPISFDLVPLTLVAFSCALMACCAGLFYSGYKENLAQTLGLIAVGIASALKIEQIRMRGFVSGETALLAIGIACFAIGVAWKVWQHARYEPPRTVSKRRTTSA